MQRAFSIGVLVDQRCCLQAWEVAMLQDCIKKGVVKDVTVLVQKQRASVQKKNFLYWLFCRFENSWFANEEDATNNVFVQKNSWISVLIDADDSSAVTGIHFDLIYSSVNSLFDEQFTRITKFGLWRIVFGQNKYFASAVRAFWEVMDHCPVTGSQLLIYRKDRQPVNAYNCTTATVPYSVKNNLHSVAWKSSSFLPFRLIELAEMGEDAFFKHHQQFESGEFIPLKQPGSLYMLFLFVRNVVRYFLSKLKLQSKKHFTVGFTTDHFNPLQPDFSSFTMADLPPNTFYADPFLIEYKQQPYIFFENFSKKSGKGVISVLKPDNSIGNILEQPYHLSYPFVFEWNDCYWMIPETAEAKNVQLYRCKKFPSQWEFVKNLISDCVLIDATVFFHQNKWWMFGVTKHHPACSTNDQLMLYYSENLLEGEWQQHPQNPVATTIANCRPAGRVFEQNGKLYRPAQNNASFQYGYGICINEIEVLNEKIYREKIVLQYLPGVNAPYKAIHTINTGEKVTVIDAII